MLVPKEILKHIHVHAFESLEVDDMKKVEVSKVRKKIEVRSWSEIVRSWKIFSIRTGHKPTVWSLTTFLWCKFCEEYSVCETVWPCAQQVPYFLLTFEIWLYWIVLIPYVLSPKGWIKFSVNSFWFAAMKIIFVTNCLRNRLAYLVSSTTL